MAVDVVHSACIHTHTHIHA